MLRRLAVVAFAVVVSGSLGACSSSREYARPLPSSTSGPTSTTRPGEFVPAAVQWEDCGEGQCGTVTVPLDHADPTGPTIDLALARGSEADPDQRIGSLVVNPGGPGASGIDIVEYAATQLPEAITDRFDVVAWDPRGSGRSAPVDCGEDLDARFATDSSPDDPGELAALEAAAEAVVDACVANTGERLRHVSSLDTVQDMDLLRRALGDDQLTYLGLSYGTLLGALYAERFPANVRALVLDGALDPSLPVEDVAVEQAKGFETSLAAFFDWCAARSSCAFHGGGDVRRAYDELAAEVDARPIETGADTFGPTQFDLAVAALLYGGAEQYRLLADGLADVEDGDAGRMQAYYESYVGKTGDEYSEEWPAFVGIGCADGPNLSIPELVALQQRAAREAPSFGAATIGLGFECGYWPYAAARPTPAPIRAATSTPIVVVGTTRDPATPYPWAEGLAGQLGNARLVTVEDSTHTASFNGIPCLDDLLTAYLVDLVPPIAGIRCP